MGRAGAAGQSGALICAALMALHGDAAGQGSEASRAPLPALDSVTVVAGGRYDEGGWHRFWLGDGYRDLWTTPIRVPVLDIDRFAGGLEFEEQGGGNQSITLHMVGADGREYIFRSVDKHPGKALTHDLLGTPLGEVVQDMISSLHPAGGLVTARLLDATPLLHVTPRLAVMPDAERLGEFRETFAGMLGTLEEIPNEGPDDTPGWAGSSKIVGTEALLERLEEGPEHRLDAYEFAMARLFDVIIGDTDRAADQWRFASFDAEDGGLIYRPIPRDRDWAFVHGDGKLLLVGRAIYPKLIAYDAELPAVRPATIQAWALDRPLLAGLEWSEWERAGQALQAALTDAVIEDAVRRMPPEWAALNGADLASKIRSRRDGIVEWARSYYLTLAGEPDIHGTDAAERLEVRRHEDGAVTVALAAADAREPFFLRRFHAAETHDIRIHLHGGDDVAIVRGPELWASPMVRIEGGGDDDVLVDSTSSHLGEERLVFYDSRGDNRIVAGGGTIVDRGEWDEPVSDDPFATLSGRGYRDWGSSVSWTPFVSYGGASGLVLGAGPSWTVYGHRRTPYAYRVGVMGYVSLRGGFGAQLTGDYRLPNSPLHFELLARGTQFDGIRFYGLGNDSPLETDDALSLVQANDVRVQTLAALDPGDARVALGPVLRFTEPKPEAGSVFDTARATLRGGGDFGRIGARFEAGVDRAPGAAPRSGWAIDVSAEGFPTAWDVTEEYAHAEAVLRGYLDIPIGHHPKLAVRVGARRAWGGWPVFDGASIGGLETIRGYRFDRFVGDEAAWGNAELRVPLFEATLITRGRVGVLGLTDAARVWLDGESPGGWHTAYGGGLFYETLGRAVSVLYAHGEEDRWYLQIGMPF